MAGVRGARACWELKPGAWLNTSPTAGEPQRGHIKEPRSLWFCSIASLLHSEGLYEQGQQRRGEEERAAEKTASEKLEIKISKSEIKKKVCCWLVLSCKIKMLSRRKSQRGQRWRGKRKKVRGQIKIIQIKKEKHHRGTVTVWAPDNDRSCPCRLTVDSCRADAAAAAWTDSSHSKIRFSSNILHTLIRAVSPCCISARRNNAGPPTARK